MAAKTALLLLLVVAVAGNHHLYSLHKVENGILKNITKKE